MLKHRNLRVHWKKVSLIGVGLLGGSLGLAIKQRRLAESVIGFVRRRETVRQCQEMQVTDRATLEIDEAVMGADLIVLCTPIAQMVSLVNAMRPHLSPGVIITDVGSVKQSVVSSLEPLARKSSGQFVGSHPMAGSEKTGVTAARPDLFEGAVCVVTPTAHSNRSALRKVKAMWKSVGSRLLQLSPAQHDELVSRSSHLPHVVAAQLATLVLHPNGSKHQAALCANGFRDTTRIASGSPEMWRDIALANRKNLLTAIDSFVGGLAEFKRVLKTGDADAVSRFFQQAKSQRDKWSAHAQAYSPE